jgi:hypothetical protein
METFLDQVTALIASEIGTLTYRLILAFSITAALMTAISLWKNSNPRQVRRMVLGLSFLLVLRIFVFLLAGLVWQNMIQYNQLIPIINRGIALLSLVVIIWLWTFPDPLPLADAATIIVLLLVITLTVFISISMLNNDLESVFSRFPPETIAYMTALGLIAIGWLILLVSRPSGWVVGFLMLGVEGVGYLIAILTYSINPSYNIAIRLAQMIAYPLLLLLPQRLLDTPLVPTISHKPDSDTEASLTMPLKGEGYEIKEDLLALLALNSPQEIMFLIVKIIALSLDADLALLVISDADGNKLRVGTGYDTKREEYLSEITLDVQRFPLLVDAMKRDGVVLLPGSSASPDAANLCRFYNLKKVGHLLASSNVSLEGVFIMGAVLLSPYSGYDWKREDQQKLDHLTRQLAQFLHHNRQYNQSQDELVTARQKLGDAVKNEKRFKDERQQFFDFLVLFEKRLSTESSAIKILTALRYSQPYVNETLLKLKKENDELQQLLLLAKQLPPIREAANIEDELKQTQKEAALLRSTLTETEKTIMALKAKNGEYNLFPGDNRGFVSIMKNLHSTSLSINEYTRFLLGESIGELSNMQRRMLLSIQNATERIESLTVELVKTVSAEGDTESRKPHTINTKAVIQDAVDKFNAEMEADIVSTDLDILPDFLPLDIRPDLFKALISTYLLQTKELLSPNDGLILHVDIEENPDQIQMLNIDLSLRDDLERPATELPEFLFDSGKSEAKLQELLVEKLPVLDTMAEEIGGKIKLEGGTERITGVRLFIPLSLAWSPNNEKEGNIK